MLTNSCSWCVCCLILQFLHFYFSHDLFACHWTYLKYSSETQTHCPLRLSWLWLVWSRTVKLQRPGTSVSSFFPDKWSAVTRHSEKGSPQKIAGHHQLDMVEWDACFHSSTSFVRGWQSPLKTRGSEWMAALNQQQWAIQNKLTRKWEPAGAVGQRNNHQLFLVSFESILFVLRRSLFFFFSCKEVTVIICILAWCPPLFILRFLPLYPTLVYRHGQVTVCRCPLPRH